uniref:RNA-directed DNA polymerase, eukaryota n=1 Tax=Tanacetum cinerariifolium TaxID=118510 RepID=A0A699GIL4_TANCI|nr:RNA-directed DNA polymerase, eukaryota [Tanacetum cinerariifolium]
MIATLNVGGSKSNHNDTAMNDNMAKKDSQSNGLGRTYMHVVKVQVQSGIMEDEMSLTLVLDDNCLMSKDVSKCLFGRVKEFASLANLKMALYNEGFMDIKIQYMGEFWVLMEFVNEKSLKLFRDNVFWIRAKETPGWVPEFMDGEDDDDQTNDQYDDEIKNGGINGQETGNGVNSDAEEVPETTVEEEGHEENNADVEILEKTEDKQFEIPPGYTPIEGSETSGIIKEDGISNNYEKVNEVNVEEFQNLSDEVEKVGQVMGYKMDSSMSNMVEIIESRGAKENYWGNLGFEYVHSDSVGNSGGIMCVWDPSSFCKSSVTISDSFVMMRGVWSQSGKDVLLIAVYAPHDFKEKLLFAGLVEVSLGGCSFTWCHKLETKIRKLDRFLLSETLFNSCPNISALSLESDLEGFGNMVEAVWKEYPNVEQNAMINMMGKLKHLKKKIQEWNIKDKQRRSMDKDKYKVDLEALDTIIDQAKVKWSIEGDKNTSFFHGVINKKRDLLNILGIMVDGSWVDEPSMVKREFFNHFRNRFDKLDGIRAITHMEYSRRISLDKRSELEGEVSNDEIKRAVWDCGTDKAPGPDGFTFGFYRRFWYLIDNDVYATVKYFFIHKEIPKGCNSSFIALILKISDANLVKDFCPISFIWSLYKIITKILTNRLAGVLGDIVNEVQSAFVADRQILDKAYDSVRWDLFDDILGKFGFGDKWRMWIQSCLKSSRGSIIINGSPTEEFQFFKGLNQGDPLSPFLFILVMESLHLSFQRVEEAEMFKGIKIGPTVTLSHMFYADDAVFVGKWCESNITSLVHVLDCFHRASDLKINMSKSKILEVHVESDRFKEAALRLGYLTLKIPFLYLGSNVGGSMSRLHEWDEVIERVKMLLSKWKMKSLSIGGRLTLLKSVLGSMTIFNMSIFKVPLGVLRTLESIRSHFFNGHTLGSNKASWAMYGDKGKIDAEVKSGSRSCWLNIVHEAQILTQKGITLRDFMRIKLGNGENTSFWEDCWIEGDSLRNHFPHLYTFESCKRITVGEKMCQPSLEFSFRRNTRGGVEHEQLEDLVTLMQIVSLSRMADRWIKYVPIKVNVNAWKVKLDALPTRFNVSRRGIHIDSIMCAVCDQGVETSMHLFFSCNMVRQTTRMITRWWDVSYEDFVDYDDWRTWIINLRLPSKNKMMLEGLFIGVSIGSSLHLSYLFYTDDAVFLGHWSGSNIDTIVRVLDCFYRALGLRINMTKSKIMGISVSSDIVDQAASKIGCATLKPPFLFRVESWMESIRCHFFNGIETDSKKQTWIKWNKVLASKEKGGLGVSSFYALNRALMFKCVWRFCTQGSSLWEKAIKGIHGEDMKLDMHINNFHPSIWLDIVREDVWSGDASLKSLYPRLFALESSKSITVAMKLSQDSLCYSFRRAIRGGVEQAQISQLIANMEGVSLVDMRDMWV